MKIIYETFSDKNKNNIDTNLLVVFFILSKQEKKESSHHLISWYRIYDFHIYNINNNMLFNVFLYLKGCVGIKKIRWLIFFFLWYKFVGGVEGGRVVLYFCVYRWTFHHHSWYGKCFFTTLLSAYLYGKNWWGSRVILAFACL